jgi:hypothetical protein
MTFKEYLKELNKFADENQHLLELPVVIVEEDIVFEASFIPPREGYYDGNYFTVSDDFENTDDDYNPIVNAIII